MDNTCKNCKFFSVKGSIGNSFTGICMNPVVNDQIRFYSENLLRIYLKDSLKAPDRLVDNIIEDVDNSSGFSEDFGCIHFKKKLI